MFTGLSYRMYVQYFQNQGTPSCLDAASSCLVMPGLASSCSVWVFGYFQQITIFKEIWISSPNFAHISYSSRTLCKPITTNIANCHKHVWEWFILVSLNVTHCTLYFESVSTDACFPGDLISYRSALWRVNTWLRTGDKPVFEQTMSHSYAYTRHQVVGYKTAWLGKVAAHICVLWKSVMSFCDNIRKTFSKIVYFGDRG